MQRDEIYINLVSPVYRSSHDTACRMLAQYTR